MFRRRELHVSEVERLSSIAQADTSFSAAWSAVTNYVRDLPEFATISWGLASAIFDATIEHHHQQELLYTHRVDSFGSAYRRFRASQSTTLTTDWPNERSGAQVSR